jgi:serine/threonine protein kinase
MTGTRVFHGRYRLERLLSSAGLVPESWEATDQDGYSFLVKLWPFADDGPDPIQRALWDQELRTLYRIGSSPGAESLVLRLRDAAVDRESKAFVMVLQGEGYTPLVGLLQSPASYPWLGARSLARRGALWAALRSVASGLALLHRQQVLHRAVTAEHIYLDPSRGPETFRLGGFEWSVRLGSPEARTIPVSAWSTPPEAVENDVGFLPDRDWFSFGMLAARLMVNVEHVAQHPTSPLDVYRSVLAELLDPAKGLASREVDLIHRLVAPNPLGRLTHPEEITREIDEIERQLAGETDRTVPSLAVVIDPKSEVLVESCQAAGMVIDADDEFATFNPLDPRHNTTLTSFVREALRDSVVYPAPDPDQVVIVGALGPQRLARWKDPAGELTWDLAFCVGPSSVSTGEGGARPIPLPRGSVSVRTVSQTYRDATIRSGATSWTSFLPRTRTAPTGSTNQTRLVEFLRASNQVELVIRDAEVFPYRVTSRRSDAYYERIVIVEQADSEETRPQWSRIQGGLLQHLTTELASNKPDCDKVVLTATRDLRVTPGEKTAHWTVDSLDMDARVVTLLRAAGEFGRPPDEGFIRTWGMAIGQVPLIERRSESIERAVEHTYLLQALTAPGFVYMDTSEVDLLVELPADSVDPPKRAVIEDVLRVRPVYALQGPPGTGKTTMVAWLLRQILADDPVAQVLVTAQAHGALDVLRHRVASLFEHLLEDEQPLAVRLGGREEDAVGGPAEVAASVLSRALTTLTNRELRTPLEEEWLSELEDMVAAAGATDVDSTVGDFTRLVQRAANLTFCTTSAGDLAELAREAQSFDWSIIEEAGKAHGFDLALPLWSGHRWLLIGDHAQLPPYRYEDYKSAFTDLAGVAAHLRVMQRERRGAGLIDVKWLQDWEMKDDQARQESIRFADRWLATFHQIFQQCQRAAGTAEPLLTIREPSGAAAGMLSGQHRMHPTIGDLISKVFYGGAITNETCNPDGSPRERVRHHLRGPASVGDAAVVWVDMPAAMSNPAFAETGPPHSQPYLNKAEVDALCGLLDHLEIDQSRPEMTFAALSPYNRQRSLIQERLRQRGLPPGLVPADVVYSGRGQRGRFAYTVDAFQGNQADIVAVSLVRNNTEPKEHGLGFLDRARMNVLLSRAERLLVLLGSWEFFTDQVSLVDRNDATHRFLHWAQVLDLLETWFESGRAVRLDAVAEGFVS